MPSIEGFSKTIKLWDPKEDPWRRLCSYLPLREQIRGDLSLSEEELELAAVIRNARATAQASERSRQHRLKRRAEDPDAFRAEMTAQELDWQE
ncbi:hypothetical protein HRR83_005834 [Exophiala dermatitidis]|nr:hypothetical protein HRR73_007410 [Exophiala dermatitidis]KAJ4513391.1 hypothetical protein HRR74_006203 [Exophiala dermatitidis]KAJ4568048.1 hypothetical protein HRR81_006960 [Exophiala dermatitidis]KAJ4595127.1 hypothetical protein HRR83_005834 [Exophiala dermatitidis]KAJ4624859.1 hypothetical protein HRR86_005280 [Exophiala dermatitidis]